MSFEPSVAGGSRRWVRWLLATLPLAPLAALAYVFSEWLFFVTKPSPTSALPFAQQLLVLIQAPGTALGLLLWVQGAASLLSLVAYPRTRPLAFVPGAIVGGFLLLTLVDNFTLTVFGFGVARSGEVLRIAYAALLPVLAIVAGVKLHAWVGEGLSRRAALAASGATLAFTLVPLVGAEPLPTPPDPSVLPVLQASGAASDRPNILFLGVDGVDAAITSAYGYERSTTPFLDSLRDDTLFFENAFSNVARTHGSLVTLLTGRLPFSTHVTFPPTLLQGDDGDKTLPKLLKSLGYSTLQLGMRHYADAEDTNIRGFDAANYRWQQLADLQNESVSESDTEVFQAAVAERIQERLQRIFGGAPAADAFAHVEGRAVVLEWRDERRVTTLVEFIDKAPQPWFVHLHLLDTHCCFWHPRRTYFRGGPANINARDSEVREADENIRRLFHALEATGQLEKTVVVISSDHASEWKITERVPLMIRFPNRQFKGRVAANVQLADVAPTVLKYLGAATPSWMDGQPLLPRESIPANRPIFGVSDVQPRSGRSGERLLTDGGANNFGASAVMMVSGNQVFEMALASGTITAHPLRGSESAPVTGVSGSDAERMLMDRIRSAGMTIDQPATHVAAASTR